MKRLLIDFVNLKNGSRVRANGPAGQDQARRGTGCWHAMPSWERAGAADGAGAVAHAWETQCDGAMDLVDVMDARDRKDQKDERLRVHQDQRVVWGADGSKRQRGVGYRPRKARKGRLRPFKAGYFESVFFPGNCPCGGAPLHGSCVCSVPQYGQSTGLNRLKPPLPGQNRFFRNFYFFCGRPTDGNGIRLDGPQKAGRNSGD